MGYSYDSLGRLACDGCGKTGGVRRRPCPYKVRDECGHTLNYCPASAYCAECHAARKATRHADCKAGAARSQAEYDARRAVLDAGEHVLSSAVGDWADGVPEGYCRVTFRGRGGQSSVYLIPTAEYDNRGAIVGPIMPRHFPEAQRYEDTSRDVQTYPSQRRND